jgi:xylan 1,4-beta-xylosidase
MAIRNPILPGFHPDPAILRVGADYYIATSTFEWHPGVQLHHSRDLVHWRPIGGALTSQDHLDLRGVPDSGGVWAPDLTYADGRFHLVYGVVDNYSFGFTDVTVFLTTAPSIEGPWSPPVTLPSRGFDPSLFHDEDGSSYLVNMAVDRTIGSRGFGGIELMPLKGGPAVLIQPPTAHNMTEGPRIYRLNGWYYLVVAEGGTEYGHGALVLRSRALTGPYEADPNGPLITSRDDPSLPLQKAGHAGLVETLDGDWYVSFLVARPYSERGRCVLGRETALQRVEWADEWPRVPGGVPALEVPSSLPDHPWPASPSPEPWAALRRPITGDWVEFGDGGLVRIRGGQSPYGRRSPSLLARRVTAMRQSLTTTMRFRPVGPHQSAGITAYYNSRNWYYLAVTADGLVLTMSDRGGRTVLHQQAGPAGEVGLRLTFDGPVLRFAIDAGDGFRDLGVEADPTILSDEYALEVVEGQIRAFGFTGAFAGLWVQDLAHEGAAADFVVQP